MFTNVYTVLQISKVYILPYNHAIILCKHSYKQNVRQKKTKINKIHKHMLLENKSSLILPAHRTLRLAFASRGES
jgi:hypothetical protein